MSQLPKWILRDVTLLSLVRAGCRSKADGDDLATETIGALPVEAAQGMAEYRLRKPLGEASVGVLTSETLLSLLLAGSRAGRMWLRWRRQRSIRFLPRRPKR